jgi:hypothetical protein
VVMKSSIFWNRMLYSPLKSLVTASCWFLAWFILQPGRWRRHVPRKFELTFSRLQSIIF